MDAGTDERTIGQLFGDLSRQLSTLIHQEIALARAEVASRIGSAGRGAAMVGLGGALGYAALLTFLAAVTLFLVDAGLAPWVAALVVALVTAAVGGAIALYGRDQLARTDLTPRRTIETLRDDAEWAKEQVK